MAGGAAVHQCGLLLLLLVCSAAAQQNSYFNNIPGDWCKTRSDPCCLLRQDDCSVPIFGTRCYCDEFCNRAVNPDCCPDYLPVCLGITPVTTKAPEAVTKCFHLGRYFVPGETTMDNCNSCTCREDGHMVCSSDKCMIDESMLQTIGMSGYAETSQYGWIAANYSMFWGRKLAEGLVLRTGTNMLTRQLNPIYLEYDPYTIPENFDASRKWPGWISRPRDQGWCGASWAFSTAAIVSDRFAIESKGREVVPMSVQNLISCDRRKMQGCRGGQVKRAWQYLRRNGVVDEECYPYNSGESSAKGVCKGKRGTNFSNVKCDTTAQRLVNREELYQTEPAYRIRSRETDIQYEIMTNGPVQAMMRVQQDFLYYSSGVYSSTGLPDPRDVGYHSVRLIGWGEEQDYGKKYWLAANSWGEEWGNGGLFKIERGRNESGIEEIILTVRAQLLYAYPASVRPQTNARWFYGTSLPTQ